MVERSEPAEIVEHLFSLVERLRTHFEGAASSCELSAAQAKALRCVAASGPVPMRDVAERLGCDASNVTGIIDRLEQRGLVARVPDATDRRVKNIVVTPAGAAVADRLWSAVVDGACPLIGLADHDRASFLTMLRRLDG